jgi:protein-disulfide isomerase-like protein with CxxC motif
LGDLADRLGVSQAKLHAALRSLGGPGDRHADIEAAVAKELGISADRLRDAFEKAHRAAHEEFAQRLADKLGIDADKVKDALPPPPGP